MLRNLFYALLLLAGLSTAGEARAQIAEDVSSPSIYAYFNISDDGQDSSLSPDLFRQQLDEIALGNYTVLSLDTIFDNLDAGRNFLPNTVALTFDEPNAETYDTAFPLLVERRIPFTIFISPGNADEEEWQRLARLAASPFVTIGLTATRYARLGASRTDELTADLNAARSVYRERMGSEARYFAYPLGEYAKNFVELVSQQGFRAAFGQNSGVVTAAQDRYRLPRFTMTDEYGDLERFRTTSNAMPFPVEDLAPLDSYAATMPPIGFTLAERIAAEDLSRISCFASTEEQPKTAIIAPRRVELRFGNPPATDRLRINCTLPVAGEFDDDDPRYRWLGFLLYFPESGAATGFSPAQP
jgi:peptidoglycan/xylan/chitin deacetylase (PgdA/CDA1 family)